MLNSVRFGCVPQFPSRDACKVRGDVWLFFIWILCCSFWYEDYVPWGRVLRINNVIAFLVQSLVTYDCEIAEPCVFVTGRGKLDYRKEYLLEIKYSLKFNYLSPVQKGFRLSAMSGSAHQISAMAPKHNIEVHYKRKKTLLAPEYYAIKCSLWFVLTSRRARI